jgi:hypothetical protein
MGVQVEVRVGFALVSVYMQLVYIYLISQNYISCILVLPAVRPAPCAHLHHTPVSKILKILLIPGADAGNMSSSD